MQRLSRRFYTPAAAHHRHPPQFTHRNCRPLLVQDQFTRPRHRKPVGIAVVENVNLPTSLQEIDGPNDGSAGPDRRCLR